MLDLYRGRPCLGPCAVAVGLVGYLSIDAMRWTCAVSVRVFIDGAVGTTGLDIRERLARRGDDYVAVIVLEEARRKDAERAPRGAERRRMS